MAILLTGCVGAAGALAAFPMYKSIQSALPASGGGVDVSFSNETANSPLGADVKRIAVLPGSLREVQLAERLQNSGRFDDVMSPNTAGEKLGKAGHVGNLAMMTSSEKSSYYTSACKSTRAQVILATEYGGLSTNINYFSFGSAHNTRTSKVYAFSCTRGQVVWESEMTVKVAVRTNAVPPEDGIARRAGDAGADRLLGTPSKVAQSN